jgi:hypothetical protein
MESDILKKIYGLIPDAVLLPIPKGKKGPQFRNWQQKRFNSTQTAKYQSWLKREGNVGVLLGAPSRGLCTIDLDSDKDAESFLKVNPDIAQGLITKGVRGCNVWVYVEGSYPYTKSFSWGEWRADGCQTVIAGTHPSGEPYRFLSANPPKRIPFENIKFPFQKCPSKCNSGVLHNIGFYDNRTAPPGRVLKREVSPIDELYQKLIQPYLKPLPDTRNYNLVKSVSLAFYNTSPEIALLLGMEIYNRHAHIWNDTRERHEYECKCLIRDMDRDYATKMPQNLQEVYNRLSSRNQIGFRICRSLQKHGKGKFFLGCRELQLRMGLNTHTPANRILHKLADEKVIRKTTSATAKFGRAFDYEWILKPGQKSALKTQKTGTPCPTGYCPECWENVVVTRLDTPWPCRHLPPKESRFPEITFLSPEDLKDSA